MLMGLHAETLSDLQPRNPHNGASWSFPPSMLLRSSEDEEDVIRRINMTVAALQAEVPPILSRGSASYSCPPAAQGGLPMPYLDGPSWM